jgi:hypothetical protein
MVAVLCLNCGFLGVTPTSLVSGYNLPVYSAASIFRIDDGRHYVPPIRWQLHITLQHVANANAPVEICTVIDASNVSIALVVMPSWSSLIHSACSNNSDRDSSVGILACHGLDGPEFELQWDQESFLFSIPVQTGRGDHRSSCTMGTGSLSQG